jgi:DNA uptake protein ComE-like DNA-binding protein
MPPAPNTSPNDSAARPAEGRKRAGAPRLDMLWTAPNLAAAIILCAAGGAALAMRAGAARVDLGDTPPMDARRAEGVREQIDLNTAPAASLRRLPGLGPVRAAAILEHRAATTAPAFRSLQDLERVRGIGRLTAESLRQFLRFPPAGDDRAKATTKNSSTSRRQAEPGIGSNHTPRGPI